MRDHRAVRPDRRRQDRGRARARAAAARARRGSGGRVGRRAAGLRGPGDPHRRRRRRPSRRSSSTGWSRSCRSSDFSAGQYARARPRRDRRAARGRPAADRGRRHRAVPARGARPSSTCARRRPRACASAGRPSSNARGAPALHAELRARAPWAAEGIDPNDRQRDRAGARAARRSGELEPPRGHRSCGAASCATRRCWSG